MKLGFEKGANSLIYSFDRAVPDKLVLRLTGYNVDVAQFSQGCRGEQPQLTIRAKSPRHIMASHIEGARVGGYPNW